MTVWDELKPVIVRLLDEQPGALAQHPSLDSELVRTPPIEIHLTPWAAGVAEELHRQFGDGVELTVGWLPYPPGAQIMPLKIFRVTPGGTTSIPLLIGTASSRPQLGYAVPPGEWGIQVTLTLGPHPRDSPRRRTPILPRIAVAERRPEPYPRLASAWNEGTAERRAATPPTACRRAPGSTT
jgi:hypothetical protein